jgi:putative addiction module component (TIGR02574 family)
MHRGNLLRFCALLDARIALAPNARVLAMREVEAILHDALDLPKAERARLVEKLTESLGPKLGAAEAWAAEISKRIERLREAPASTVTADDLPTRGGARGPGG